MLSIVPTTFHPEFVGGPNLGAGINPSLVRKVQIVQFWLDQEYAGVTVELFQGSPSGSSASGGTHLGPGDAGDFVLTDSLGRSPSVAVWIAFSAMMQLLDCLSYVRGSDVNADGRKDDTFDQHCHVIDREGAKVWAATLQISQYLAHQNGLVGGRADLEATVTNPLTLAQYTDAGFMLRYQSLSGAAFTLDTHTEPRPQGDLMFHLGGKNLPSYLISANGAVVQLNEQHQEVGMAMARGDTSNFTAIELALAKDIINALRENKGF